MINTVHVVCGALGLNHHIFGVFYFKKEAENLVNKLNHAFEEMHNIFDIHYFQAYKKWIFENEFPIMIDLPETGRKNKKKNLKKQEAIAEYDAKVSDYYKRTDDIKQELKNKSFNLLSNESKLIYKICPYLTGGAPLLSIVEIKIT